MAAGEKIWVVRQGDGRTVAEILVHAGSDADAVRDGRVFVGRKRVTQASQPVRPGDTVRISSRRKDVAITILFEQDGIVACVKPAGLPTVPDHSGASHALVSLVARQIGKQDLRVTSRLDRDVSGVVLFAVGAEAEERLRRARAEGRYARRYVAIARGVLGDQGVWDAPIGREQKAALTRWRTIARTAEAALLAVDPVTGRTHQIRIHASHAGAPLVGDREYGPGRIVLANGSILAPGRIALHAARVRIPGLPVALAAIPDELAAIWQSLGGEAEAWDRAVACEIPS